MGIDWDKGTETCDFWVGFFPDEDSFAGYVGESAEYYTRDQQVLSGNIRTEGVMPLSEFIGDQGHVWFDHDLIEMGFNADATTMAELVEGYSYCDQYVAELTRRASETGIRKINAFLFIRSGEIDHPRSVKTDEFDFRYVGQITYKI